MLLDRGPSWRQCGGTQPVNQVQDFGEQGPWDGDLRQLERDIVTMADHLGTDLHQLLAQRGHQPVLCFLPYGRLLLWVTSGPLGGALGKSAVRGAADENDDP